MFSSYQHGFFRCPVQMLMIVRLSADLLCKLFETLYDEEIVSEDAFVQWESSSDPAEQRGKGIARVSTARFFDWLRSPAAEADQES